MSLQTVVEWVDARERLPRPGIPVAAATHGFYPPEAPDSEGVGEEFWLVLSLYFTDRYFAEDGSTYENCFVDSDRVVRFPPGGGSAEVVTHWAALPTLPGSPHTLVMGADVQPALRRAHGGGD
ncbi:AQJ64_40280 family protein [Streptomyces longwoodensis]|nr:AQJ64_40280 family protein [Streptomyces lasalocidi]MCX4997958.1 amine oxidase [Streptomyces longwoodensis]WRY92552.1 amine oxidase [Streptomyces longwoodensis]WTI43168.1 amine oxidase [Streptomyces longwoodensis]WUC55929.1 amine oxidase [Streptomyces longwoodensis]WUC69466.1 amine oxidase [Streptomyces longwoodensis]